MQSQKNTKQWTEQDWEVSHKEFADICTDLTELMQKNMTPECPEVLLVIERHFKWLNKFWSPNKESYAMHGQFITESELKNAYNKYNPNLAEFISEGIQIFADKKL